MKKIVIISLILLAIASWVSADGLVPCGGGTGRGVGGRLGRCCDPSEVSDPVKYDCMPVNPPDCEYRCKLCHFFVMAKGIIDFFLLTIIPPVAILLTVIGGAYFIIGSGYNPTYITKGKSIIGSVAMGLLIVYGAWVFVNLFFVVIGLQTASILGQRIQDWFVFPCAP
ncbi:MAG: hypothetical protein Q8N16_03815 [bacterium]|nr:hypothetical protein [bacterium]